MSSKDSERETAKSFFAELGTPVSELLTLKEFARRDPDPDFNSEHLDSVCPDVVVITGGETIGLELTAYSDSNSHNALSEAMHDLSDAGSELAKKFQELNGFTIYVSANNERILRKRDVRKLAEQLFDFVRSQHAALPFDADQGRHYSVHGGRAKLKPFAGFDSLEKHVQSINVKYRTDGQNVPVILSGGFGRHFGTRLDHLAQMVAKKTERRKNAYTRGLTSIWLLIHATGYPRSSRIAPLRREETERLILSIARQTAIDSGFDRVFVWDGVRGGLVDLVSAELKVVLPA